MSVHPVFCHLPQCGLSPLGGIKEPVHAAGLARLLARPEHPAKGDAVVLSMVLSLAVASATIALSVQL